MAIFLRHSHNVKPVRWGSEADIQYAIAKNSEKIYGVDPDSNVLVMPLFWGFPCLDYSGKQNHGTPVGGVAYDGQGLDFDRTDDKIIVPHNANLSLTTNWTFLMVLRTDITAGVSSNQQLAAKTDGTDFNYSLAIGTYGAADRKIAVNYKSGGTWQGEYNSNSSIPLAEKCSICHVKNGSNFLFYINGSADGSANDTEVPDTNIHPLHLFGHATAASRGLDGGVWSCIISNSAYTAEQIALFYARKWDLYRRVGRTYYSVAAAPSVYIPQIMIF